MNLDDLRKIAEEATPGPWEVATMKASSEFGDYETHGIKGVATPVWYSDSDMAHTALEDMGLADAEFIATFNPETVLALLDRVETAEQELGKYDRLLERTENEYNRLETSHSILERALQRVRELHAKHENTIHTRPEWVCAHRHCVDDSMDQNAWPCPTIRALEDDE